MTPRVEAQHPLARIQSRRMVYAAVVYVGLGFAAISVLGWTIGAPFVAGGGYYIWWARRLAQRGRAVLLHNAALERVMRGQVDEAEELLNEISPAMNRWAHLARATGLQRALIALYRGDAELAVSLSTAAIALTYSRFQPHLRSAEQGHQARVLALRALAHASVGEAALAERDAAASEASPGASADVLARAALARAVTIARTSDTAALATHLGQTGALMLEFLTPRERALVRALRRMARARPKSVYREAATPDDAASEEARLAAWIGKLAPNAQAFVMEGTGHARSMAAHTPGAPASPEAVRQIEQARQRAEKTQKVGRTSVRRRLALVWALLVVVSLAVWQLLTPASAGADLGASSLPSWSSAAAMLAVVVMVLVGLLARRTHGFRDAGQQLLAAQLDVARGRTEVATSALEALTRTAQDIPAAGAHLSLAQLAERGSSWEAVIDHSTRGVTRLSKSALLKAATSDVLFPELLAARAFALVALGRQAEADAEMAVMDAECPSYVHAARAHFRVALLSAVRGGELTKAAELARGRAAELPLSLRDDMLADVVLAATSVVSKDERERITGELDDDSALRAWIDAAAPGLREASRVRVGSVEESRGVEEQDELATDELLQRKAHV